MDGLLPRPPSLCQVSAPEGDAHSVGGVEFGEQPGDVGFDGGFAHVEVGGDVGVGVAASDFERHFAFAVGERGELFDGVGASGVGGVVGEAFDERAGDGG